MRTKDAFVVSGIAGLALLVGCDAQKKPRVEFEPEVISAAQKRTEFRRASLHQRSLENDRAAFIAASERKLAELDAQITELAKNSDTYTGEAKMEIDQTLESLQKQRAQVKIRLEESRIRN
jgi:hypothetical protein